ncbi:hypothetical protein ABNQ39_11260 [Azospirillum sp. A26]|uniref:hypothetical protein n=1 Tax=Azospirillum sp. A26 TaxID=3160607 RepID=UPI00366D9770
MESIVNTAPPLRECPCCAGPAYPGIVRYDAATVRENGWSQDSFHSVSCAVCGLKMSGIVGFKTPEAAAEAWNRRETDLPVLKASTEALTGTLVTIKKLADNNKDWPALRRSALEEISVAAGSATMQASTGTIKPPIPRPDYSHLRPEGGRFSFAYSPDTELPWVGWRFDDREAAHQFRMMLDSLRQQPLMPAMPSPPDPLGRVVSPDGEWLPRMWDLALGATDSEANATAITLKMVAASHGYRAAWVRQEVPDELADASPATILAQVAPSSDVPPGCLLVGRTMDEDGIVNWYVRPVEDIAHGGVQS